MVFPRLTLFLERSIVYVCPPTTSAFVNTQILPINTQYFVACMMRYDVDDVDFYLSFILHVRFLIT